jgi:hypothetical protein
MEIVLDVWGLYLYHEHPKVFKAEKIEYRNILFLEAISITIKVVVLGVMVLANHSSVVLSLSPVLLLACFSGYLWSECLREYDDLYDSIFSLVSMVEMPLEAVFLIYRLIGWLTAIVFMLHVTFLLVMFASELLYRKGFITIKKGVLSIILSFNYFFYTLTYFAAVDYSIGRSRAYGIPISSVVVVSCVYLAAHGVLVLVYHRQLDQASTWKTPAQDAEVEFKDLTYMINLVKSTPTYFVSPATMSHLPSMRAANKGPVESDECLICCVAKANCIVFDCMHTGACRDCCIQELKRTDRCMICRRPVSKIAVTVQVSDTEYKVVEEITLATHASLP